MDPAVNNPTCTSCRHVFSWREVLRQLVTSGRRGGALWGVVCSACGAQLRVSSSRVLLIFASGIFFGSQTSTLLVLRNLSTVEFWLIKLWLIVGFYAIAIFAFLKLESAE